MMYIPVYDGIWIGVGVTGVSVGSVILAKAWNRVINWIEKLCEYGRNNIWAVQTHK